MSSLYKLQVKLSPDTKTQSRYFTIKILFVILFIFDKLYFFFFLQNGAANTGQPGPPGPPVCLFIYFFQIMSHIKQKSVLKLTYHRESVVALLIKFKCQYTKKLH